MRSATLSLIVLHGVLSGRCLNPEDNQRRHSCLLQVSQGEVPGTRLVLDERAAHQNNQSPQSGIEQVLERLDASAEQSEKAQSQDIARNVILETKQLQQRTDFPLEPGQSANLSVPGSPANFTSFNARAQRQKRLFDRLKFMPAAGTGGKLKASLEGICDEDKYTPSLLEQHFFANAIEWTTDEKALCEHLESRFTWIQENADGDLHSGEAIFSRMCKKGKVPQLIEPLAGILRDPRMICDGSDDMLTHGIEWLVVADEGVVTPASQKIFFDAGGSRFRDAMAYFTGQYGERGIQFDHIYVWEAKTQGTERYWSAIPEEARKKWEPRLTFFDGVPVSADPQSENNPLNFIKNACKPEDFCVFKLDIDAPSVELPIIDQLLAEPAIGEVLDEFFFEHHVEGLMQEYGWGKAVNGTIADSYSIFTQLREMGVRAHSWI